MACACSKGSAGGRNPNIEYELRLPNGSIDPQRYATSAEANAALRKNGGGSYKPVEAKKVGV